MTQCILVVDDDREIVNAIAILLEKEGYQVLKAYDGLQALDLLATRPVHLILMDVMMPKLDGLSAILRIRERKNLPIIILSAKSEETDKVLGLSMGADDYVAKPYNSQELAARVRSHLRRYTSLGDIHAASLQEIENGRLCWHGEELCLLYTSDAADDGYSVDLGGRRIIKKIFFKQKTAYEISEGLVGSEMCIRDRI